jgi:phage terminase large subunit-like protein
VYSEVVFIGLDCSSLADINSLLRVFDRLVFTERFLTALSLGKLAYYSTLGAGERLKLH